MEKKQKNIAIIVAVVIILLIIIIALPKKQAEKPLAPEGPEAVVTEQAVPEVVVPKGTPAAPEPEVKKFKKPTEIVPEASPVTLEGIVVTEQGEATAPQAVIPGAPESPKQSKVLTQEEKQQVAQDALELEVNTETGFNPSQFSVKAGQVVSLVLTATDNENHTFRFKHSSLRGVAITVSDGESRAVTFNAPAQPGIYDFTCGEPDHRDKETGTMFVTAD